MSKSIYNKLLKETKDKIDDFLDRFSNCIINEEASVFIGAGVSSNSNLPSWRKLLEPCIQKLNLSKDSQVSLYKIAQYYCNKYTEADLRQLVNEQINQYYDGNSILSSLLNINFKSIWTTNYDTLIENELSSRRIRYNVITDEKNLTQLSTHDKVNIYKINGDVSTPNKMVLTQSDYEQYEYTHSLFLTFLKKELVSNTFLFVGYSFEDQVILNCLSSTMRLLEEAGNLHYALIYIDDKVSPEVEYKVLDLRRRYNIESIFVNSETLLGVIQELEKRVKANKVFISGAYYDVPSKIDRFADDLSKALVCKLYDKEYRISTGIGRRLGTYITGYANQYLAEKENRHPQKFLSMRPFPFHLQLTEEQKKFYRTSMQSDCSSAIFLFGQSEQTTKDNLVHMSGHYSQGVYQEFIIAQELGLRVIPIGSTGYESEIIWNEVKKNINRFYYLTKKIDALKNEKDPQRISDLVISILEQCKK